MLRRNSKLREFYAAGQTAVVAAAQKHLQARDEKHLAKEDKDKKLTQFKVGS